MSQTVTGVLKDGNAFLSPEAIVLSMKYSHVFLIVS